MKDPFYENPLWENRPPARKPACLPVDQRDIMDFEEEEEEDLMDSLKAQEKSKATPGQKIKNAKRDSIEKKKRNR